MKKVEQFARILNDVSWMLGIPTASASLHSLGSTNAQPPLQPSMPRMKMSAYYISFQRSGRQITSSDVAALTRAKDEALSHIVRGNCHSTG
jgi:hypothetical protein